MRIARLLATALLVGVTAVACSVGSDNANGGLADTSWTVVSIAGAPTIVEARPTIAFAADGAVSGTTGCNTYTGRFMTDGDKIEVGPELATTMMACEPARNAQEQAFTAALTGATNWELAESGSLELRGRADMVAEPAAAAGASPAASADAAVALPGTSWLLASIGDAPVADVVPTLEFGADGSASGNAGCNTYNGTYTIDGATIAFGPLISTKMACGGEQDATESAFLGALQAATGWSVDAEGRLVLEGTQPLTFVPA
ncbi:MAG TPA: META domain-containing protein [Candidatus Saccharimonadales bacterium]|nr:META domain-containing protein [Candidatus Saccharimonadales bacterium]